MIIWNGLRTKASTLLYAMAFIQMCMLLWLLEEQKM